MVVLTSDRRIISYRCIFQKCFVLKYYWDSFWVQDLCVALGGLSWAGGGVYPCECAGGAFFFC